MKLRYALLLVSMLVSQAAMAQLATRATEPQLIITSPASIAATIGNYDANIPQPPYVIPDTSGANANVIIGTSLFYVYDAVTGDSTNLGAYHTRQGVTGEIALALTAGGDLAFGCVGDAPDGGASDIANAGDLAGKIVMIQRGPIAPATACGFYVKAQRVEATGAIAFIVYNNPERDPDTAINMAAAVPQTSPPPPGPPVTIPGVQLPWSMAEPIINAIANGETVQASMVCDPIYEDACDQFSAGEGGPSASGAGLFVIGQNPTSTTARLAVRTPAAENVSVAAYNMLGQRVAVLFEGAVLGQQEVALTTTGLPAGSYFIRAIGETFMQTQQITVVR